MKCQTTISNEKIISKTTIRPAEKTTQNFIKNKGFAAADIHVKKGVGNARNAGLLTMNEQDSAEKIESLRDYAKCAVGNENPM
jgi:hypothetical protein